MFLAQLRIENFRIFGEGAHAMVLPLTPGLTALIGENDTGKTAVIDALRFVLGTRDHEYFRVEDSDFHVSSDGQPSKEIRISCKFDGLTVADRAAFSEHLTYEIRSGARDAVLYVNWKAVAMRPSDLRRYTSIEIRSGKAADGPQLEQLARVRLCATYLRPLRDAQRAMSAGRGSRLSQILHHTKEIRDHGEEYDPTTALPNIDKLSVRGIGDYANALLTKHEGVRAARDSLNNKYLAPLSFAGDRLQGHISVSGSQGGLDARLRALLEKLDLELRDGSVSDACATRGLGSNNILFMACELLLLGSEAESFPLLLIEEPEAHLHPQRQLRLVQFLQKMSHQSRAEAQQQIQVIITTHSPNLASTIDLDNLILMHGRRAFPLAFGHTKLELSDYRFLSRFLDVTKANLFFARGLLIVEGDAENILVPAIASLLGRNFTEHGVSIVNVGSTGLRRFARIFMRKNPTNDGIVSVPVACLADFDVLPNCAPEILGRVEAGREWPELKNRKWRAQKDFTAEKLLERRATIEAKASGQRVRTFVADECTLEYDLAFSGLSKEVWIAAWLACDDERIHAGKQKVWRVIRKATKSYSEIASLKRDELSSRVYAKIESGSKAIAAQHLASLLERRLRKHQIDATSLQASLPKYLVEAIEYVAPQATAGTSTEKGSPSG